MTEMKAPAYWTLSPEDIVASLGLISPIMIAAITMACSSLLVVGNSLRLRKI